MRLRRITSPVMAVAAAGLVLLLSAARLAPPISGSPTTGPKPPSAERPEHLARIERVRWIDGHRAIELLVRDGLDCRPTVSGESSTAPARIEVTVLRPSGVRCAGDPRWWGFTLRPPLVMEPGQSVDVHIGDDRLTLHRYRR